MRCDACLFYRVAEKGAKEGFCLVNLPQLFAVPVAPTSSAPGGGIGFQSLRPVTRADLMCAQWRASLDKVS